MLMSACRLVCVIVFEMETLLWCCISIHAFTCAVSAQAPQMKIGTKVLFNVFTNLDYIFPKNITHDHRMIFIFALV